MKNLKNKNDEFTELHNQVENVINKLDNYKESNKDCYGIKNDIEQIFFSMGDIITKIHNNIESYDSANNQACVQIKHMIDTNKFNGNPNFVMLTMDLQKIYNNLKR